jgi:glycosyltransferase involved in cell wall biosynthesis
MSYGLTAAQLALRSSDFVFMNTVAIYDNYREVAMNMLAHNRISNLHWFIHEDEEQLKVVKPILEKNRERKRISKFVNNGRLIIYVPSLRVKKFYDQLLKTDRVKNIPLNVDVPQKFRRVRLTKEYSKLNFYISGTPSDGRKGQLIALAAFNEFRLKYAAKNPSKYRDYSLHLVSIKDDYISQQIKSIGKSTLGDKLRLYPPVPREEALGIAADCNVVICCSLNETFALYVAEGMLMGHIVLRNDTAGKDEQLVDGKNGFLISDDISQFSKTIERLLNKSMTTEELQKMGTYSQKLMKSYSDNNYLDHFKVSN